MLETGWSEATLLATSRSTIARMRFALYSRAHRDELSVDIDERLRNVADAELSNQPKPDANRIRRAANAHNGRIRDRLRKLRPRQVAIRQLLSLDVPDEIPAGEE